MEQDYVEITEAIHTAVKAVVPSAIIGFLPPAGGCAIQRSGGTTQVDLAGNVFHNIRFSINVKAKTQLAAVQMIDKAHTVLSRINVDGDHWQIYGGHPGQPAIAAQDAQGWWIMTSDVMVKAVSDRRE